MTLLIIHCPAMPFQNAAENKNNYGEQLDQFDWCLCETNSIDVTLKTSGTGNVESMPYADEVIVLMPTIDVRLLEAKVPLVKSKKLQQILPSIIEEEILGGVESSLIYALPPIAGQIGSQRTLAVIDKFWFSWLSQQLRNILTPRLRVIPDCFILPLSNTEESNCLGVQYVGNNAVYTWHQSEQLGISWAEDKADKQLPSILQNIKPVTWSWEWMVPCTFRYSQRTDIAAASLNLLLASPGSQKSSAKFSLKWFGNHQNSLTILPGANASWLDNRLWVKPTRWATYTLCSFFMGLGSYAALLAIDDWRWSRNINISAAHFLSPEAISLLSKNNAKETISGSFIKQLSHEARSKGFATDGDFAPMVAKLQQLKVSLNKDNIDKIEYNGYHIDFQFKTEATPTSSSDIIQKAQSLGLMVTDQGNNQYRLLPYSGLGIN